mgnify:CR=1 FL=1
MSGEKIIPINIENPIIPEVSSASRPFSEENNKDIPAEGVAAQIRTIFELIESIFK